jgi:hypothetical protein
MKSGEPHGQVTTRIGGDGEGAAASTVISAGRVVEQGARSMLILARGLFRLDVIPSDDTIQTVLRSLEPGSAAALRGAPVQGVSEASGDVTPPSTARFGGEVVLVGEDGEERAVAKVLVASVFHPERGETAFTAQARLYGSSG